jgi:hypothetical protein
VQRATTLELQGHTRRERKGRVKKRSRCKLALMEFEDLERYLDRHRGGEGPTFCFYCGSLTGRGGSVRRRPITTADGFAALQRDLYLIKADQKN